MVDAGDDMSSMVFQWATGDVRDLSRRGSMGAIRMLIKALRERNGSALQQQGDQEQQGGQPRQPGDAGAQPTTANVYEGLAGDKTSVVFRHNEDDFVNRIREALGDETANDVAKNIADYLLDYGELMERQFEHYNQTAPEGRKVSVDVFENGLTGDDLKFGIIVTAPDSMKEDVLVAHARTLDALDERTMPRDIEVEGIPQEEIEEMAIQEGLDGSRMEVGTNESSLHLHYSDRPIAEVMIDRAATRTLGEDCVAFVVPEEALEKLREHSDDWRVKEPERVVEHTEGRASERTSAANPMQQRMEALAAEDRELAESIQRLDRERERIKSEAAKVREAHAAGEGEFADRRTAEREMARLKEQDEVCSRKSAEMRSRQNINHAQMSAIKPDQLNTTTLQHEQVRVDGEIERLRRESEQLQGRLDKYQNDLENSINNLRSRAAELDDRRMKAIAEADVPPTPEQRASIDQLTQETSAMDSSVALAETTLEHSRATGTLPDGTQAKSTIASNEEKIAALQQRKTEIRDEAAARGVTEPTGMECAKGVGDINGTEKRRESHEIIVSTDKSNDKVKLCTLYAKGKDADALSRDLKAVGANPQKMRKLSHSKLAPDKTGPNISSRRATFTAARMAERAVEHAERASRSR